MDIDDTLPSFIGEARELADALESALLNHGAARPDQLGCGDHLRRLANSATQKFNSADLQTLQASGEPLLAQPAPPGAVAVQRSLDGIGAVTVPKLVLP